MKIEIQLKLYVVRNAKGQFFRSKGYGGYGKTWVDDIQKAKVYTKIGQARSRVTWFANTYPEYGIADVVELDVTSGTVLNEGDRVRKAQIKKKRAELEYQIRSAQRRVEEARNVLNDTENQKAKFEKEQKNLDDLREVLKKIED